MKKKQVLVVEDNELNRAILCEILSAEYSVLEAENGLEALNILKKNADNIYLILLDIMMPIINGYEFLDIIRRDETLSITPVIVTTQSSSEADEIAALDHGATDFISKPYRAQVILHRVASLIKLRESAALANQLKYDRLTGVYNLEYFCAKARELLDEFPEKEYNLVCSNIDNFKIYNDTFGWDAGNELLITFSRVLTETVADDGLCARLGADRFIIMQEREKEQALRENMMHLGLGDVPPILNDLVISLGIYEIDDTSIPVERMCIRAQLACDSISGQYGHRFAMYDDSFRKKLLREQQITSVMKSALEQEQFIVYYQPKYSLEDNRMSGSEALVRWIHPEWGFLPPSEFIPLFEKNGFINKLDLYVFEHVCAQIRAWQDDGLPVLPVSVNISRADVYHSGLIKTLLSITQKYGVSPSHLHLEITESAYAKNPAQIISTVDELRKLGFAVEMDDFGSGYSSLNMLSQMHLDILKLDAKFIQYEISKSGEHSILSDVIRLAHRLHLRVVAEGVETKEQVNRLRIMGCDYVQGFYFARPMPNADYEALVRSSALHSTPLSFTDEMPEKALPTVLLVEDDPDYIFQVRNALSECYTILDLPTPEAAISALLARDRSGIDIIILSAALPNGGASYLLDSIRRISGLLDVPIIVTIPDSGCTELLPLAQSADDFICKCHPVIDLHRHIHALLEATSSRLRNISLQNIAYKDFLSGLLNRSGFHAAMSTLNAEDMPAALILFDINSLKHVNKDYGRTIGDRIICAFSDLLSCRTRQGDILCRYGGDEFIAVLLHMGSADAAISKADSICQTFRTFFNAEDMLVSCSAGVVLCPPGDVISADTVEHAYQALRQSELLNTDVCLWEAPQA